MTLCHTVNAVEQQHSHHGHTNENLVKNIETIKTVDKENVKTLENNRASTLSMVSLFLQADNVIKLVMILLFLFSIWSTAIIFNKLIYLWKLKNRIKKFEQLIWSGQRFDTIYSAIVKKHNDGLNPFVNVFAAAFEEQYISIDSRKQHSTENLKDRIFNAMSLAMNKSVYALEEGLSILAIIGSSAPFIGLFGTVWGIIHSFQSIAVSKNANLATVAPGISEALFATAIGLLAAIPATMSYNKFTNDINLILAKTDDFCIEIFNIILRENDKSNHWSSFANMFSIIL